jgi:hypothetical protein
MAKAQILEVFMGSDEIARFDADQDMNEDQCRVATEYARYVIFRENNAEHLFGTVIHDGLTSRIAVVKPHWFEDAEYVEEEFSGLSYEDAHAIAAQDDVDEFDGEEGPDGSFSGSLTRKRDRSRVVIDAVAPEEFLIEPRAVTIRAAAYCGHRTKKTRAELKEMGYDPAKVDAISEEDSRQLEQTTEVQARQEPVDTNLPDDPIQPDLEQVTFYESYVRMVIEKEKGARLYKICHAGNQLLDQQEVDKAPFIAYVPLPVPHILHGNNFAARVIPVQNARTVLTRAVLDHSSITTNPRWVVVNGGLLNPKEMLENRLGGLVNARRPDSVSALQYPNLNPFVFEVLGMLKEDKEQSTGISSLSQGLNKDAISKQNSAGLIDNLVSLSSQRGKLAARNFAKFLVELMFEVVRLGIANEKKEKVIEIAGQPFAVNPSSWTERRTATVSMHLGYGEKDQAVQKQMMLHDKMSQDPKLSPMYTPENAYNLIRDTAKLAGITGMPRYITHPSKVDPPQPDPLQVMEVQAKTKTADAAMITAQSKVVEVQHETGIKTQKAMVEHSKTIMDAINSDRDNDRKDLDVASRVNVQQREIKVLEETPKKQAYVAPDA